MSPFTSAMIFLLTKCIGEVIIFIGGNTLKLKIMVCGSIGYNRVGASDIKNLYSFLQNKGFSIVNHIVQQKESLDYSHIIDFRDKKDISHQIVSYDLQHVKKADLIVVIANGASYGTSIEMFVAKNSGKTIILLAKESVSSPWPIAFSDYIVKSDDELIQLLYQLQADS